MDIYTSGKPLGFFVSIKEFNYLRRLGRRGLLNKFVGSVIVVISGNSSKVSSTCGLVP